jgi:hypothetical protein
MFNIRVTLGTATLQNINHIFIYSTTKSVPRPVTSLHENEHK